jgi:PII-like signaling protein
MRNYQPAKLVRLHFVERDRYQGKPLYEAIVQKCRELKIAGATVFRGLEGYGETAEIHRSHLLTHDLPIVVTIADTEENVNRLLPEVERMVETGLIVISDVQICRIQRSQAKGNVS